MRGIWPILFAYFNAADALDRDAMRQQVRVLRRCGAPGIALLGLATEVNKLSADEKHQLIAWTAEDVAGALPLAVTLSGATPADQLELARHAVEVHSSYLILQPPARAGAPVGEAELEAFFTEVLNGLQGLCPDTPIGIQNAPEFLGVGLSFNTLARLRQRCPNLRFMKGEAPAVTIERWVDAVGADFPVLNGRGGLELLDNLSAGCSGMIVAPDTAWEQQAIAQLLSAGEITKARMRYQDILEHIVFVMQSLEALVVYGKRVAAWRSGMDVLHDRACAQPASAFGLSVARRFAQSLGPFPQCELWPAAAQQGAVKP